MSIEKLTKPEDFINEITKLNERLEKLENEEYIKKIKAKLDEQLVRLGNREDIEDIRKKLIHIESDIKVSEIMSSIPHKNLSDTEKEKLKVEVSEIIDSLSDKEEKTIRKPKVSKKKRYNPLDAIKGKINKIITYINDSVIPNMKEPKKPRELTSKDKMKGIIDLRNRAKAKRLKIDLKSKVMEAIRALKYKPQHAKQNRYVAKGKEMAEKIRALSSNVAKGMVTKVSLLRKKIAINIEKAKIQRQSKIELREKEKAKIQEQSKIELKEKEEAKIQEQSKIELIEDKTTLYRPKIQEQSPIELKEEEITLDAPKTIYTAAKGTKSKMREIKKRFGSTIAAAALLLTGISAGTRGMASISRGENTSIYNESIKVTPEYLEAISKVENKNNAKPSQDKEDGNAKPNQSNINSKPEEKPSQNNTNSYTDKNNNNANPSQSNSNISNKNDNTKPTQNNTNTKPEEKPENNNKPEDQIKKIYGGEISASENGIRTEADILYAVKKIGWSKDRVENIKEMMPGLLAMQRDFDIDPLCALTIFQCESGCGIAYTKYGQHRIANIEGWDGQEGVIGYSGRGFGLYEDFSSAAYDFGNYVRNSDALKGAKTMYDLEYYKDHPGIFQGASTQGLAIYNKLKSYLEKRVTLSDISNATRTLTSSEIKEMTATITSSINKQMSSNKAMSGR